MERGCKSKGFGKEIYVSNQIGKVASVHSIQPLSAFDNSYIQKMIC